MVVSGNGANGYYPWIDHANHAYGIVAVEDHRGAQQAVPASKVVMDLAVAATALAGAVLCWLRLRAHSLAAPAVLHLAGNSLAYLLAWTVLHSTP